MERLQKFVEWLFKYRANLPSWLSKSLILTVVVLSASYPRTTEAVASLAPSPTDTPLPPSSPSPTLSQLSSTESLIDDLEDGDAKNQLGGYWYTYSDKDNGGDSQVSPSDDFKPSSGGANNSSWAARMTGTVTTTYQYGFIGMGTNLGEGNNTAVDVSKYQGIEFCAKGDGKEYRVKLRSLAINDYNDYGYKFVAPSQWQCYQVRFGEMEPSWQTNTPVALNTALAQVSSIQWQTVGQPHTSVELAVDDLKFLQ